MFPSFHLRISRRGWNLSESFGCMSVAAARTAPLDVEIPEIRQSLKSQQSGFPARLNSSQSISTRLNYLTDVTSCLICALYKLSVTVLGRIVVWQALLKHKNDYYDYVQADCVPLSIPQSLHFLPCNSGSLQCWRPSQLCWALSPQTSQQFITRPRWNKQPLAIPFLHVWPILSVCLMCTFAGPWEGDERRT